MTCKLDVAHVQAGIALTVGLHVQCWWGAGKQAFHHGLQVLTSPQSSVRGARPSQVVALTRAAAM